MFLVLVIYYRDIVGSELLLCGRGTFFPFSLLSAIYNNQKSRNDDI